VPYRERPVDVIYPGLISSERGAKEMIRAVGILPKSLNARFTLAGKFVPPLTEADLHKVPGWDRTNFVGHKSRNELGQLLGRSRVGLVVFHAIPGHTGAIPNKLFEYMSAGLPVVAANIPLWRSYIEDVNCALFVDPTNPEEIAQALLWLLDH